MDGAALRALIAEAFGSNRVHARLPASAKTRCVADQVGD
jgi:hypothetical protein